jgi:hypothetical protein
MKGVARYKPVRDGITDISVQTETLDDHARAAPNCDPDTALVLRQQFVTFKARGDRRRKRPGRRPSTTEVRELIRKMAEENHWGAPSAAALRAKARCTWSCSCWVSMSPNAPCRDLCDSSTDDQKRDRAGRPSSRTIARPLLTWTSSPLHWMAAGLHDSNGWGNGE